MNEQETIRTTAAVQQHGISAMRCGPNAPDGTPEAPDVDADGWNDELPFGKSVSHEVDQ